MQYFKFKFILSGYLTQKQIAAIVRQECHPYGEYLEVGGYKGTHNVCVSWILYSCIIPIIIVVGVVFVIFIWLAAAHAVHHISRLCIERFYIGGAFCWCFVQVDFWHAAATVNILKYTEHSVTHLNLRYFLLKPGHCGRATYKVPQIWRFRAIERRRLDLSLKIKENERNRDTFK